MMFIIIDKRIKLVTFLANYEKNKPNSTIFIFKWN
jgi:hypothetical protein